MFYFRLQFSFRFCFSLCFRFSIRVWFYCKFCPQIPVQILSSNYVSDYISVPKHLPIRPCQKEFQKSIVLISFLIFWWLTQLAPINCSMHKLFTGLLLLSIVLLYTKVQLFNGPTSQRRQALFSRAILFPQALLLSCYYFLACLLLPKLFGTPHTQ